MKKLFDVLGFKKQATVIVACCCVLSACDSGGGPISPTMDTTTAVDQEVIIADPVFNIDAVATQDFVLLEDTLLRGQFFAESIPPAGPISIRSLPAHGRLQLQEEGAVFLYTPNENYFGTDGFTYLTFENLEVRVFLNIGSINDAPTISANLPRVAEQGRIFDVLLEATDVDSEELQFTATDLPSWLQLNATSGQLSGVPTQSDVGITDNTTFRVTDNKGLFTELTGVQFEVIDINDAPTLNLSQLPSELKGRETVTANVFPDDPDGDAVLLSVESNAFVESQVDDGSITLTAADVNDVTYINLVVIVEDDQGRVTREIFPITINPVSESGNGLTVLGSREGRGVHIVLLGDGYASDQQNLFREHAYLTLAQFGNDSGIGEHLAALNVHMIGTLSVDSGADDNEQVDSRDTAFDSAYNCGGIFRLICANTLTMFETALNEYPAVDQIVLLVNDKRYGGSGNSGGSVAITSAYFPEIALHEMGHSLVDLADEYVDPLISDNSTTLPFQEGRYRNVTALTDPALVPWAHWINNSVALPQQAGEPGVGLFEGGLYRQNGIYRSTYNSRMRTFDSPFGVVNSELWILRLYTLTEGIRGYLPTNNAVAINAGESQEFIVSPIFTDDIQAVEWKVNGAIQVVANNNPNRLVISPAVGIHSVTLTVRDITGKINLPLPHAGIFTQSWELEVR
jgi:hypothetical protein